MTAASSIDLVCESCGCIWHSYGNRGRWCPACRKKRNRAQSIEWAKRPDVRERRLAAHKAAGYSRRHTLKKYGLTEDTYAELLEQQGGVCAICSRPEQESDRLLSVDHCHKTGAVRGLLCNPCNRAIGQLGDNLELLSKAHDYLLNHEKRQWFSASGQDSLAELVGAV